MEYSCIYSSRACFTNYVCFGKCRTKERIMAVKIYSLIKVPGGGGDRQRYTASHFCIMSAKAELDHKVKLWLNLNAAQSKCSK